MIIRNEILYAKAQLMQVADASDLLRSPFGLRNCREQKRGENSDDGNDYQQFNQSERKIFFIRVQSVFHPWLNYFRFFRSVSAI